MAEATTEAAATKAALSRIVAAVRARRCGSPKHTKRSSLRATGATGSSRSSRSVPRGRATPLHRDPSDETFYILAGELLFHIDGTEHTASPGDTLGVRKGVPHAFVVTSETARFLVFNTPGTHDSYFRDGGEPATDESFATAPEPNYEKIEAASRRHGVEMLGPPPVHALVVGGASSVVDAADQLLPLQHLDLDPAEAHVVARIVRVEHLVAALDPVGSEPTAVTIPVRTATVESAMRAGSGLRASRSRR